jgi:voltage-gated potassium channel
MLPRRLLLAFGAVVSTLILGTAGYWLIGDGEWSLVDCLYMTVIGLSTAGFGEILPLGQTAMGRPFTILLLLGGMVSVGWFVATAAAVLIEGELTGYAWRRRMDNRVKKLSGHTVVCGAGSTGIHCVRELSAIGAAFVKDNLFVTVTARALNPALRIVAKAIDPRADAKLRRAGADSVVSPNMIGGMRMVAEMVRPEVVSFLDVMTRDKDRTLRIEEVPLPAGSRLAGRRVADLELARHRLLLLAVKPAGAAGATCTPPGRSWSSPRGRPSSCSASLSGSGS